MSIDAGAFMQDFKAGGALERFISYEKQGKFKSLEQETLNNIIALT